MRDKSAPDKPSTSGEPSAPAGFRCVEASARPGLPWKGIGDSAFALFNEVPGIARRVADSALWTQRTSGLPKYSRPSPSSRRDSSNGYGKTGSSWAATTPAKSTGPSCRSWRAASYTHRAVALLAGPVLPHPQMAAAARPGVGAGLVAADTRLLGHATHSRRQHLSSRRHLFLPRCD